MLAASYIREDAKYMPDPYKEEYIQRFSRTFFTRIKDVKEDKNDYKGTVNRKKLYEFMKVLKEQSKSSKTQNEKCFLKIARIIATYTTFVLNESIHPIGTKFPGGFSLHLKENKYVCPVKNRQKDNPSALCRFCVAVQDTNMT